MTSAFFRSHSASFKVDSTSVRGDYASFKGDSDSLKVISHLSKINNKTIKEAFFYCKPIKDRSLIKKTEMKAFSWYENVNTDGFQQSNREGEGKEKKNAYDYVHRKANVKECVLKLKW